MSDPGDFTAATALAALQETRDAWAERSKGKGVRYDALYGLVMGTMVGGQALLFPFNMVASLGGAVAIALMAFYWARRTGVWINGAGPKRARWVALGVGTFFILAAGGVYWAGSHGMAWIGWPAGAVAAVVGMLAARLWRWVYRSDIADGTDTQPDVIGHRPFGLVVAFGGAIVAVTCLIAWLTHAFESELFFYAVGAGVGVIFAALMMALVRSMVMRRRR